MRLVLGRGGDDGNIGTGECIGYTSHWQEEGKMKQKEALEDEEQQLQDPLAGVGDISSPYASLDYLIEM